MVLLTDKQIQEIKEAAEWEKIASPKFATFRRDQILALLADREELLKYAQHLKDCAKWGDVYYSESAVWRWECREYDSRGNKIRCTCGLSPILEEIGKK